VAFHSLGKRLLETQAFFIGERGTLQFTNYVRPIRTT
jgi:hypothetical protein